MVRPKTLPDQAGGGDNIFAAPKADDGLLDIRTFRIVDHRAKPPRDKNRVVVEDIDFG
ncbi:hypothetical protein D9M71_787200 [compost metagenome]